MSHRIHHAVVAAATVAAIAAAAGNATVNAAPPTETSTTYAVNDTAPLPDPGATIAPRTETDPTEIATGTDQQTEITNALNQAGTEFMLAVTVGTLAGGVIGLIGGCVVGAVVGLIGGCIPGLALGAALGPIIGGAVVGIPVGIAALIQAYNKLHAAGDIRTPTFATSQ